MKKVYKPRCILRSALGLALALTALAAQGKTTREIITMSVRDASVVSALRQVNTVVGEPIVNYKTEQVARQNKVVNAEMNGVTVLTAVNTIIDGTNLTAVDRTSDVVIVPKREVAAPVVQAPPARVTVTGMVRDAAGNPVVGASVMEVGNTTNGTATSVRGWFSLNVPQNARLTIQHLGYVTQEVAAGNGTELNVVLQTATTELDDVVVVGYGTQRKGSIVGSIATIDNAAIVRAPAANLSQSLAGKLPGLRVVNRGGMPGENDATIDIRGFGAALIVVDGVPVYNNSTSGLSQLDPNDIESITVLKDASAAVYGVKAANGVVLVTTKRGQVGTAKVNLSTTFSWQRPTAYPKMANAAQFVELKDEEAVLNGIAPTYGREVLEKYRNGEPGYESYDYYDLVVRPWSPTKQYNINVRGGNENVRYFTSLGYTDEMGMWRSGDLNFKRFNARANVDANLGKGWSMAVSAAGRREAANAPSQAIDRIMGGIQASHPMFAPYANNNPDYYARTNTTFNPLAATDASTVGYNNNLRHTLEGSLQLKYDASKWVDGLSAKAMYYYRFTNIARKLFEKKFDLYTYNDADQVYTPNPIASISELEQNVWRNEAVNFQGSIDYAHTFGGRHDVSGMLLLETRKINENYLRAYRDFSIDAIDELNSGNETGSQNGGTSYALASIGLIGRFNYAFDKKYLFEFSFREDGSSKFPTDGRWGFFPSLSGGWMISSENFLKNTSFIDHLKLRASWGRLGDESDGWNNYSYVTGYEYPDGDYIFGGENLIYGLAPKGMANPYLTWFTSDLYNVGVDFSLWSGKLGGSLDAFYRKRNGLMATKAGSVPGTYGTEFPQMNLNSDSQRGFEIELTHRNTLANGLRYAVKANAAYTRSKWGHYELATQASEWEDYFQQQNGRWMNSYWGWTAIGQFQSYEEIATAPHQDAKGNSTLRPGDIKYLDYNGDGAIDAQDKHLIGRGTMPEYTFGLDISAQWKGFDLVVFLQGAAGFNMSYSGQFASPFVNSENTLAAFTDRWHHADIYDPTSPWVAGKYPSTFSGGNPNNSPNNFANQPTTFWMQDCSYLRLKELQLGYTIPAKFTQKVGISNVRVFATAYNMVTWTRAQFLDPESLSGNGRYYPQQKSWSFGINMSF